MAVRSAVIVPPTLLTGIVTVIYTAPAGEVTLIKDLVASENGTLVAGGARISIRRGATALRTWSVNLAAGADAHEKGLFWVLMAGDELLGQAIGAGVTRFYCSGAKLVT